MIRMHGEYRRHLRSGIRVPVILTYANHTIEANTLDISAGGLRLKRPERVYIRPGEAVDVDFRDMAGTKVAATVTHSGKSHIGLQFYRRRFSENELNTLYGAAPAWQRLTATSKRALWKNSRRFAVFLANTYLRAPFTPWPGHGSCLRCTVIRTRPGPTLPPAWQNACPPIWCWGSSATKTCAA